MVIDLVKVDVSAKCTYWCIVTFSS